MRSARCELRGESRSLTRRDFIFKTAAAGALALVPVRSARGMTIFVAIAGIIVVGAAAAWVGWKLGNLAKTKLNCPPPVPGNTNAVPPVPAQHPPNSHPSLAPETHCGDVDCLSGTIWGIDSSAMADGDKSLITLPDGSLAVNYASASIKGGPLEARKVYPVEIWFSGTAWVVKHENGGDEPVIEQGIVGPGNPFCVAFKFPLHEREFFQSMLKHADEPSALLA